MRLFFSKLFLILIFVTFSFNVIAGNFENIGNIKTNLNSFAQNTDGNNIIAETFKLSSSILDALGKALSAIDASENKMVNLLCVLNHKMLVMDKNILFENFVKNLMIRLENVSFYCENFDLKIVFKNMFNVFSLEFRLNLKKYRYIIGNGNYKRDMSRNLNIFNIENKNAFANTKMLANAFLFIS
jgi:hypothetical protein